MSGFFELLAGRAAEPEGALQPRRASRFETPAAQTDEPPTEVAGDAAAERRRAPSDSTAPAPAVSSAKRPVAPMPETRAASAARTEASAPPAPAVRERIETVRVERREPGRAPADAPPPPAAVSRRERNPEPSAAGDEGNQRYLPDESPAAREPELRESAPPPEARLESTPVARQESVPPAPLLSRAPLPAAVAPPAPSGAAGREPTSDTPPAPTIRISIGTVEIRAVNPAAPAPARPATAAARSRPSLDDYLAARGRGKSR